MRFVRYNKASDSYVVKIQGATKNTPALYQVTLGHGDLAIPHGVVEKGSATRAGNQQLYHTYLYSPGHAADLNYIHLVGTSVSLQEAIADVRKAWEK